MTLLIDSRLLTRSEARPLTDGGLTSVSAQGSTARRAGNLSHRTPDDMHARPGRSNWRARPGATRGAPRKPEGLLPVPRLRPRTNLAAIKQAVAHGAPTTATKRPTTRVAIARIPHRGGAFPWRSVCAARVFAQPAAERRCAAPALLRGAVSLLRRGSATAEFQAPGMLAEQVAAEQPNVYLSVEDAGALADAAKIAKLPDKRKAARRQTGRQADPAAT